MAGPTECRPRRRGLVPGRVALLITVAGTLAVCGLAVLFAAILDNVLDGDGVTAWDGPISTWIAVHREPALTTVMRSLTEVGNPPVLAAIMALAAAVTTLRVRALAPMILGAVAVTGFALMVLTVKLAVGRPRPPVSQRAIAIDGSSFPSGHATGIAVVAVVSVWMLTRGCPCRRWTRAAAWTAAIALIVAVGFSRVYLGVHYPSDIVAGWALGAGWAGVLIAAGTAATPLWSGHPPG